MVSLTLLEVDAKVGLMHFSPELWPDERFVGAKNFLTCTKVKIVTEMTYFCYNLLHHGPTYWHTGLLLTIDM